VSLTNVRHLQLASGATNTISGAFTYGGTSRSDICIIGQNNSSNAMAGTVATLSVAQAITLNWMYIKSITKAGAGSITAINSFDGGGNTNVTIINPTLVYGG
jgi:hypothetical protein